MMRVFVLVVVAVAPMEDDTVATMFLSFRRLVTTCFNLLSNSNTVQKSVLSLFHKGRHVIDGRVEWRGWASIVLSLGWGLVVGLC